MKIENLDVVIKTRKGDDMKNESGEPLKLREAICVALDVVIPDRKMSGEQKYKRHRLMDRVSFAEGGIELTNDEVTIVKEAVEIYNPHTMGQIWDIVDPALSKKE